MQLNNGYKLALEMCEQGVGKVFSGLSSVSPNGNFASKLELHTHTQISTGAQQNYSSACPLSISDRQSFTIGLQYLSSGLFTCEKAKRITASGKIKLMMISASFNKHKAKEMKDFALEG